MTLPDTETAASPAAAVPAAASSSAAAASRARIRRAAPVVVVMAALALGWELYKLLGQWCDDTIPLLGWSFPVPTDDTTMPHLWSIVAALGEPVQTSGSTQALWRQLLDAAIFTSREAAIGLVIGTIVGICLAFAFEVIPLLGKALVPWILVSQTIPFVATAPMVVIWGGRRGWPAWVSVSIIAAYLVFFPVVVNVRRGLASADAGRLELMRSYAASRTSTLFRLKVPVALPYLFTGLRLAATAAVVGAIVGELPSGQRDGVGRLLLTFTSFYDLEPERLFAAVGSAALLGLCFVGIVVAAERLVLGPRRKELP